MGKKRAMSSEKASQVKRKGHLDANEFAELIGIGKEYKSDPRAKKDVIDTEGMSYSVKSGEKKWQIFLYGKTRFETDATFGGLNGLGRLFLECINSFPESREEYLKSKLYYKKNLQKPIRELSQKLSRKELLAAFLEKSIFNSGEVDFLVIKDKNEFHIFYNKDVIRVLTERYIIETSKAKTLNQVDDQKVLFKVDGKTHGEIEMRNDSEVHYREVKFWLSKKHTMELLKKDVKPVKKLIERIYVYGKAIKKLSKYIKSQ